MATQHWSLRLLNYIKKNKALMLHFTPNCNPTPNLSSEAQFGCCNNWNLIPKLSPHHCQHDSYSRGGVWMLSGWISAETPPQQTVFLSEQHQNRFPTISFAPNVPQLFSGCGLVPTVDNQPAQTWGCYCPISQVSMLAGISRPPQPLTLLWIPKIETDTQDCNNKQLQQQQQQRGCT